MAGHSKFRNIMYRKEIQDCKRAKLFSKLSHEITTATKIGGINPNSNSRLRLAISAAKAEGMPKHNIQRAIVKYNNNKNVNGFYAVRYEGYGPAGVAVIVEALTNNRSRTASEIRTCFKKNGGIMQTTGSVVFQFHHLSQVVYSINVADNDDMLEAALEAGAYNITSNEEHYNIYTDFSDLSRLKAILQHHFGRPKHTSTLWLAKNWINLTSNQAYSLSLFIEMLKDNNDVQQVFSNGSTDCFV